MDWLNEQGGICLSKPARKEEPRLCLAFDSWYDRKEEQRRLKMDAKQVFKKNQVHQGQVVDLTHEGQGVVKIDGYPFFVEGVIPGEQVAIKVLKVGKSFGFARLEEILTPSPDRVEITDPIGRQIGTMTLQHMSYPAQLKAKQALVKQVFSRLGKFPESLEVRPTHGMDHPWQYRNKAQIPVRTVKGQLETGFFRKNSHQLVPVENFHIQDPAIDQAILKTRDILRQLGYSAYDEESRKGQIRHIIVKRGHYSGQVMLILVVNGKGLPREEQLVEALTDAIPNLVSLVLNSHTQANNVIMGPTNRLLWGRPVYQDQMLGLDFSISPHSFYQVNTPQAEALYRYAIEAADLSGSETVLDAYCGIGTISLALARQAGQVYAMEIVPEAIDMARANAEANGLTNVTFQAGKAEEVLPSWQAAGITFDVAVVDPPRKGLDPEFVKTLIELAPAKIVYVSCNPATCARDCQLLAQAGYELQWVQPVDLFPQTAHVEAVSLLVKE